MGAEAKLEKQCTQVAKANGWWSRKFSSPSNRGVPDRIFLKDRVVFIEFKVPGKSPTPLQQHEIDEINKHGGTAYWITNVKNFKIALDIHT